VNVIEKEGLTRPGIPDPHPSSPLRGIRQPRLPLLHQALVRNHRQKRNQLIKRLTKKSPRQRTKWRK